MTRAPRTPHVRHERQIYQPPWLLLQRLPPLGQKLVVIRSLLSLVWAVLRRLRKDMRHKGPGQITDL
jgi:hypothetical protein